MKFEDFEKFIDAQDTLFCSAKDTNKNERERIYVRTIKLGEEFGELCDEVLGSVGDQRKDKLKNRDPHTLNDEFADVMITLFMLAKSAGVDVMGAVDHKVQRIRKKYNKELS